MLLAVFLCLQRTICHLDGSIWYCFGEAGSKDLDAARLIASAVLIGARVLVEPELIGGALLGAGGMYALHWLHEFCAQLSQPLCGAVIMRSSPLTYAR